MKEMQRTKVKEPAQQLGLWARSLFGDTRKHLVKTLAWLAGVLTVLVVMNDMRELRQESQLARAAEKTRTIRERRTLLEEQHQRDEKSRTENARIESNRLAEERRIAVERSKESEARAEAIRLESLAKQHMLEAERARNSEQERRDRLAEEQRQESAFREESQRLEAELYEAVLEVGDPSSNGSRALMKLWNRLDVGPFRPELVQRAILTRMLNARSRTEIDLCFSILIESFDNRSRLAALLSVNRRMQWEAQHLVRRWLWSFPSKGKATRRKSGNRAHLLLEADAPDIDLPYVWALINRIRDERGEWLEKHSAVEQDREALSSRISLTMDILSRTATSIGQHITYDERIYHESQSGKTSTVNRLSYDLRNTYLPDIKWPRGRLDADFSGAYIMGNDFSEVELYANTVASMNSAWSLNFKYGDRVRLDEVRFVSAFEKRAIDPDKLHVVGVTAQDSN